MRRSAKKLSKVTSERLWTLFPVGTDVVFKPFMDVEQIFIVKDYYYPVPRAQGTGRESLLECWCYDWDGIDLIKSIYHLTIPELTAPKSILELDCYPLQYHPNPEMLREKLVERGKNFVKYCLPSKQDRHLVACKGPVIPGTAIGFTDVDDIEDNSGYDSPRSPQLGSKEDTFDIIIDAATFIRYGDMRIGNNHYRGKQTCECKFCNLKGSKSWVNSFKNGEGDYNPEASIDSQTYEKFFSLLPFRAMGVIVKQKRFGQFPIDQISDVDSKDFEIGWNSLQLSQDHKLAMRHLVAAQLERKAQQEQEKAEKQEENQKQTVIQDLVPGKGEGLVILLHGKSIISQFSGRY